MHGICVACLSGEVTQLECRACLREWRGGSTLQVGTMYKFDVFAAEPCCAARTSCLACRAPLLLDSDGTLPFFSQYSEERVCSACNARAFHFVREINDVFRVKCH